jgi:hypothetical protein
MVSIVAVLLGGNPRVLLVRESFFTGALGVSCFVSLVLLPRPLMFYFGRYFATGECVLRVGMGASTLPIPVVLAISPVIFGAITVATIFWTFAYARRAHQHGEAMRRAPVVSSAG